MVRFSLRARSFTASRTSSSMASVVRTHQMLAHHSRVFVVDRLGRSRFPFVVGGMDHISGEE